MVLLWYYYGIMGECGVGWITIVCNIIVMAGYKIKIVQNRKKNTTKLTFMFLPWRNILRGNYIFVSLVFIVACLP